MQAFIRSHWGVGVPPFFRGWLWGLFICVLSLDVFEFVVCFSVVRGFETPAQTSNRPYSN